ncbi:Solute carrier 26 [Cladochytrium tenue]|nr:Solute carrier 26 [Cladochytrium tenue]
MSPNRELVAIGAANVFGSVFGGWPAFGSLGRSAVNDASGARTQVAGFVTGVIILVTIVALLPLFYFLPKAVCSAIIVVAATKLIELHDVVFILKLRAWNDLGLLLLTFLSTLLVSIEVGTLISVGTSLLLVVQHTTKTRIAILGRTYVVDPASGNVKVKFRSISDKAEVERIEGSLVIRVEEGLFFGNTGQLKERLNRVEMYGELGVHPGEEPRMPASAAAASAAGGNGGLVGNPHSHSMQSINGTAGHAGSQGDVAVSVGPSSHINSVILDIGAVTAVDATATQTLLEIVESYRARGITVCFVKLRDSCRPWFARSGLLQLVGEHHFFHKIRDALDAVGASASAGAGTPAAAAAAVAGAGAPAEPVQAEDPAAVAAAAGRWASVPSAHFSVWGGGGSGGQRSDGDGSGTSPERAGAAPEGQQRRPRRWRLGRAGARGVGGGSSGQCWK